MVVVAMNPSINNVYHHVLVTDKEANTLSTILLRHNITHKPAKLTNNFYKSYHEFEDPVASSSMDSYLRS